MATIRAALGRYPALSPPAPDQRHATLLKVTGQLVYLEQAFSSSHFTVVSQHLPRLLDAAQAVVLTASAVDQVVAHRVLVGAYRRASSVLLKFDAHDIGWLAADRAMQTAAAVDDTLALARATRGVARALSSIGQRDGATATVIGMTDRMRTELAGRNTNCSRHMAC